VKAYFGRRYMMSASHRLHAEALSAEENRAAYGKCNNPARARAQLRCRSAGEAEPVESGDWHGGGHGGRSMKWCASGVLDRFDHADLNLDSLFANRVPTTENLCRAVFGLLKDAQCQPASWSDVRVEETENNFFECCEASENRRKGSLGITKLRRDERRPVPQGERINKWRNR
jgi:6-pyruvoyltetrahydropterin/6-carboxytetrahydropterin synthase